MAPLLLDYTLNGRERDRMGNRHPAAAPHGVYPCRGEDRWCTIACQTDAEWEALCRVMGSPPWSSEDRFATLLGRKAHEDELDSLVSLWTEGWDAYDLMRTLQQAGVPAGVVQTTQDLFDDPQVAWREVGEMVGNDKSHLAMGQHRRL